MNTLLFHPRIQYATGAFTDQAVFAATNFVLNVILARWLSEHEYGWFTISYTIFLFVAAFHTALITEPMLVFGPSKYEKRLSSYLSAIILGHWFGMAIPVLLLFAIGTALYRGTEESLSAIVWSVSFATPCVLFLWTMRRACYVILRPILAGYASIVYLFVMVTQLALLSYFDALSVPYAFAILGSTSLFTGIWLVVRMDVKVALLDSAVMMREIQEDHWRYGRWSIMTSVLMWIPGQVAYVILPLFGGIEESAGLRALINLTMPYILICTAAATILVPAFVKEVGVSYFDTLVAKYSVVLVGGGILYWLAVSVFAGRLLNSIYDGRYVQYSVLVWILGCLPMFSAAIAVFGAAHRAMQKPDDIFWAYAYSTIATLTVGIGLIAAWDITGAVLGLALSYAITAGMLIARYIKNASLARKHTETDAVLA